MSAIECCRTAELGGHRLHCEKCDTDTLAYNSCRNRHCPKCQASAAERWLEARQADLLPIPYFHVVFTLPEALRGIAYQNKTIVYGLLFKIASETLLTIAGDERHLGAKIGITAVLHTWGSSLIHHPHIHCIVTGGGLAPGQPQWIACRPNFLVPVKVLSRYFRHWFLAALQKAYDDGALKFYGDLKVLEDPSWFAEHLRPLKKIDWVVYAKRPFAGPQAVLRYLSRYTHRIAISNRRLVALDERGVTFRYKDYRDGGKARWKSMTLSTNEFIRRFLQHILPRGFHRIRHYGLLANGQRQNLLSLARECLNPPVSQDEKAAPKEEASTDPFVCRSCGAPLIVVAILMPQHAPRAPPPRLAA
jgi:hypothetical protein